MIDSLSRPLVFEQMSPILVSSLLTDLFSLAVDFDIAVSILNHTVELPGFNMNIIKGDFNYSTYE